MKQLYYELKNNAYDVRIMWCLLVITIIILLTIIVQNTHDELEIARIA